MYPNTALTITTALFSTSLAIAIPASRLEPKQATPCSGLEGQAQCCALDVFGIVGLQCSARTFSLSPLINLVLCSEHELLMIR